MTTEVLFTVIIFAILLAFGWYVRESNREKSKLINGILAKSSQDMVNMTLADQTEIKPEVNKLDPDLVSMDQLDDEGFDQHIQRTLGNEVTDEEMV